MEVKKTLSDKVEICEVIGRIDATNAKELETSLLKSIEVGNRKIIIDLGQNDYISSAGLRVFLFIAKKIGKDGFVYLCNLQEQVNQIFTMSGFNNIFKIYKSREDALNEVK
jgi:stage II sporulation protein AA (anti-sigma F factor antagonist)